MLSQEKLIAFFQSERSADLRARALAFANSDIGVSLSCANYSTTPSDDDEFLNTLFEVCSDNPDEDAANIADCCRIIPITMLRANPDTSSTFPTETAYDFDQCMSIAAYFSAIFNSALQSELMEM